MDKRTPRTDGFLTYLSMGVVPDQIPHSWVKPLVEHARQLETENRALRDSLKDVFRILEAAGYTMQFSNGQKERIQRAKTILATDAAKGGE